MKFVDIVRIRVKAGRGGNGCLSFRREKFIPKGGPDGADGGAGGDVYIEASPGIHTLADFEYNKIFKAQSGEHGKGKKQIGATGDGCTIQVPCGTIVYDVDTKEIIADLVEPGEKSLVARGGKPGRGNAYFASSVRKTPRFAEKGEEGEEKTLTLELKLIADVGLVGSPNAGKSSLLAAISNAHPRIAGYPFTTLSPNLGILAVDDQRIVVADVPGLIEGASDNKGLGIYFLRHVERTRVLLHVVDLSNGSLESVFQDWQVIRQEIEKYDSSVLNKPYIVIGNKMDLKGASEVSSEMRKAMEEKGIPFYTTSAIEGEGIDELIKLIVDTIRENPRPSGKTRLFTEKAAPVVKRTRGKEKARIIELGDGSGYKVIHTYLEKAVRKIDFSHDDALPRFSKLLKAFKIEELLEEKGAEIGDNVYIGETVFEFQPEEATR